MSNQYSFNPIIHARPEIGYFPPAGPFPVEKAIWVETILNVCEGESLKVDGYFEQAVWSAIRRFQQKYSLPPTGGFDNRTLVALTQRALNLIQNSSLLISGIMDARTKTEIVRFQICNLTTPGGIVDSDTRAVMVAVLNSQELSPQNETHPLIVKRLRGVDYSEELRSGGLNAREKRLLDAARKYFRLPPKPTNSIKTIVGVLLIEGIKPIPFHSGIEGGPWGGVQRGNIARGPGSGMDRYSSAHIEGHAVAKMWELGKRRGVLLIEKDPCTQCNRNLPQMLPRGGSLSVVSPQSTTHYFSSW
jgi:peptidoglycan hydrolase-like protein with peptidoglycan-binding domain